MGRPLDSEVGTGSRTRRAAWTVRGALLATLALSTAASAPCPGTQSPGAAIEAAGAQPFALVELFTSEGCSSCPPADRLLSDLAAEARREHTRVFPLAFHVDYWNGLGWTDPWSKAAFSDRQASYTGRFESRYTPQMIVNGHDRFVGSDRARARRSIGAALASPASADVQAWLVEVAPERGVLRVGWRVAPAPRGVRLHAALVERGLRSRVTRGENRGRDLTHDNVVRSFQSADLPSDGQGESAIDLPPGLQLGRSSIVLFLQDTLDHRVLGATAIDLEAAPPAPPRADSGLSAVTERPVPRRR